MKTRLAVILVLAAAVAVTVALLIFPTPAPVPPVAPVSPPPPGPASPAEVVVAYLQALEQGASRAAYDYLSSESQRTHPYESFVEQCESGSGTEFELSSAREAPEEDGRVLVTISLAEDPAEGSFTTVEETGGWRVVFIGGAPWFPYP
jgi:hypothetical protein